MEELSHAASVKKTVEFLLSLLFKHNLFSNYWGNLISYLKCSCMHIIELDISIGILFSAQSLKSEITYYITIIHGKSLMLEEITWNSKK